jgi:predicted Rossmann fold flavoprotein
LKFFDVIIIGAGAAGLMCAATASSRGKKVLLIDHAKFPGEKIRISGGGRCNFTNIHTSPKNFISSNPHFCVSALKRYSAQDFIGLVKKHNIAFHEKTLGQLFCDGSAKQIISMLLAECAAENFTLQLETKVNKITKTPDGFAIETSCEGLNCEALVIATGGPSIPKMGATGFGYEVAKQFGLKIIEPRPALVPLTFLDELLAKTQNLSGVAVEAIVSLKKIKFREAILFTHRGISGPAILQISSYLQKNEIIKINFAPEIDIFLWLQEEKKAKPKQEIQNILAQILPRSLVNFILSELGHFGVLAEISLQKFREIANFINAWSFVPSGTEGFAKAEVTIGGIDTDEISSKSFECKKVPGLFFIGEVLDVTGWLGGYNFQWAWASGKAAGITLSTFSSTSCAKV